MPDRPRAERTTQNRVAAFFTDNARADCLGYEYLGDWSKEGSNRNIEPEYLSANLKRRSYTDVQISVALRQLQAAAEISGNTLYDANLKTYGLCATARRADGAWRTDPQGPLHRLGQTDNNDFAWPRKSPCSRLDRRPDIVRYINGIALRSSSSRQQGFMAEGIRQLISNQESSSTRDSSARCSCAAAMTRKASTTPRRQPEEFQCREGGAGLAGGRPERLLDRPLAQLFDKAHLLDFLYHFVIFDAGSRSAAPASTRHQGVKSVPGSAKAG